MAKIIKVTFSEKPNGDLRLGCETGDGEAINLVEPKTVAECALYVAVAALATCSKDVKVTAHKRKPSKKKGG